MNIKLYDEFNEELITRWSLFQKNSSFTVFQTVEWLQVWWKTFKGTNIKLQIVIIENDSKTIIILPLMISDTSLGLKKLSFLGQSHNDYNAPLLSNNFYSYNIEFKYIWKKITNSLSNYDFIHFTKQPELINNISNPMLTIGKFYFHLKSFHIDIEDNWDVFYSKIKSKVRLDSQRQIKKLNKLGNLEYLVASSDADKLTITKKMIEQKSRRYNDTGVKNIFNDRLNNDFYLNLSKSKYLNQFIHISALLLDNQIIATHLGLQDKGTYYYLMPTFESGDWKKFSSSRILLEFLLKQSMDNKDNIFDFTVGGESYKKTWCNSNLNHYQNIDFSSFKGFFYYSFLLLKIKIKANNKLNLFTENILSFFNIKL